MLSPCAIRSPDTMADLVAEYSKIRSAAVRRAVLMLLQNDDGGGGAFHPPHDTLAQERRDLGLWE